MSKLAEGEESVCQLSIGGKTLLFDIQSQLPMSLDLTSYVGNTFRLIPNVDESSGKNVKLWLVLMNEDCEFVLAECIKICDSDFLWIFRSISVFLTKNNFIFYEVIDVRNIFEKILCQKYKLPWDGHGYIPPNWRVGSRSLIKFTLYGVIFSFSGRDTATLTYKDLILNPSLFEETLLRFQ